MDFKILLIIFISNFISSFQKPQSEFTSPVLNTNKKNPNWLKFADKTYYFDTVFRANFYKSMQFCRQQGMHLLSINSKIENDKIGKFIIDNGISFGHFWTSATNLAGHNEWIWLSTGQSIVYTNWYQGEPNQNHNSTENCIEARHWGSTGFTWNDLNCQAELYFICESITDCVNGTTITRK